jgi:2,3-bisphosphoglycerate-dependent phosphoglycerate mutase
MYKNTSPIGRLRAVETVEPLADAIGTEIVIEEGFEERSLPHVDDFGATVARLWENPTASVEGGESHERAQQRGVDAVGRTLARWPGNAIAVGTHGTILALILNYYDSRYNYEFWKQLTMPDVYRAAFRETEPYRIERIDPDTGR